MLGASTLRTRSSKSSISAGCRPSRLIAPNWQAVQCLRCQLGRRWSGVSPQVCQPPNFQIKRPRPARFTVARLVCGDWHGSAG